MTVFKRSTLALISVVLMLLVAGYLNYKYNPNREQNLGQTVYVNGKDSFTYENISIYKDEIKEDKDEFVEKGSTIKDDSIAVFKYDRDNMFSELGENYSKIISNENSDTKQIKEYQVKLDKLIEQKNLITMVENVIKSKGIEDIVIIPTNNDNINVIIKTKEEISNEIIAQIQQLIVDQLGAEANKISIIVKNEMP